MLIYKKLQVLLTKKERKQLPGLLSLMLLGMLLETIGVGLVIPALAIMTQGNVFEQYPPLQPWLIALGNPTQGQLVVYGMLALLSIYALKTTFVLFMLWRQNKYIFALQASLSHRLFTGYLHQPWSFHLQRNSGQLIFNTTTQVRQFVYSSLQSFMLLLTEGFVLLGIVTLLLMIEPVGALLVMGVFATAAWVFQVAVRKYLLVLGKANQHHEGMRIQQLQQGLGGVKDVKILGRELEFINQYQVHNHQSARTSRLQKTITDLPRLWLELLAVAGLVGLVLILLKQGKPPSELLPILGLFAAAAFRILPSTNRIMSALQNLRFSLPVVNTLYREMQLLDQTVAPEYGEKLSFKRLLTLEKVSYQYNQTDHSALKNVSLTIAPGASIGFIGKSGAGKSTLVDVILGLLQPMSGRILVDDLDIQDNLRGWQNQIGYVPQSIFLTDDTLRRNIAFGLPDDEIDDEAVKRSIQAAQLEEFVEGLSNGVNTLVGERGVRLSGGQRQRIGIARALYHDPAVLVLDEATSALDMATEKKVMEAINALQGQKTLLIIAHRLSTVSQCDWIYKMDQGEVVASGRFEDVINEKVAATE